MFRFGTEKTHYSRVNNQYFQTGEYLYLQFYQSSYSMYLGIDDVSVESVSGSTLARYILLNAGHACNNNCTLGNISNSSELTLSHQARHRNSYSPTFIKNSLFLDPFVMASILRVHRARSSHHVTMISHQLGTGGGTSRQSQASSNIALVASVYLPLFTQAEITPLPRILNTHLTRLFPPSFASPAGHELAAVDNDL